MSDVTKHEETAARARRGRRPLHAPARRDRRARLPRDRPSRRAHRGALPGPGRGPPARRRRPRQRTWRTGRRRSTRTTCPRSTPSRRRWRRGPRRRRRYRLRGYDGVTRWVHDRAVTRRRDDGVVEVSGIVSDVTERRRMEDELREAHRAAEARATTDELTGVFNRRHFAVARGRGRRGRLLRAAAARRRPLQAHQRRPRPRRGRRGARRARPAAAAGLGPDDVLARWGGEEFAVLVRGVESAEQLARRAYELLDVVALTPVVARGVELDAYDLDRRHPRGRRPRHARRADRARRPPPLRRQARRPQPRVGSPRRADDVPPGPVLVCGR